MKKQAVWGFFFLLALIGCEHKKSNNLIFLDFKIGMNRVEYNNHFEVLVKDHKITRDNDGQDQLDYYTFKEDGYSDPLTLLNLSPCFYKDSLVGLALNFGFVEVANSTFGTGHFMHRIFSHEEDTSAINKIFDIYKKKYGEPARIEKKDEREVAVFSSGDMNIYFDFGRREYHDAKIVYTPENVRTEQIFDYCQEGNLVKDI